MVNAHSMCSVRLSDISIGKALSLAVLLLALGNTPATVMAQASQEPGESPGAPVVSYRAIEDKSLDLMLDYEALVESEGSSAAAPGSFRASQDVSRRVDLSRRLGKTWNLDPVLIHRRQAGEPTSPDDDRSDKLIGIELRKSF